MDEDDAGVEEEKFSPVPKDNLTLEVITYTTAFTT